MSIFTYKSINGLFQSLPFACSQKEELEALRQKMQTEKLEALDMLKERLIKVGRCYGNTA